MHSDFIGEQSFGSFSVTEIHFVHSSTPFVNLHFSQPI